MSKMLLGAAQHVGRAESMANLRGVGAAIPWNYTIMTRAAKPMSGRDCRLSCADIGLESPEAATQTCRLLVTVGRGPAPVAIATR